MPIAAGASSIPGPAKSARAGRAASRHHRERSATRAAWTRPRQAPDTAARPRMNSVPDQEKPGAVVSSRMNTAGDHAPDEAESGAP